MAPQEARDPARKGLEARHRVEAAHSGAGLAPAKQADDRSSGRPHRGRVSGSGSPSPTAGACHQSIVLLAIRVAGTLAEGVLDDIALRALEVVAVHAVQEPLDLGVGGKSEGVLAVGEQDLQRLVVVELAARGRGRARSPPVRRSWPRARRAPSGSAGRCRTSAAGSAAGRPRSAWPPGSAASASTHREAPARARVQAALGNQLDPLAP